MYYFFLWIKITEITLWIKLSFHRRFPDLYGKKKIIKLRKIEKGLHLKQNIIFDNENI